MSAFVCKVKNRIGFKICWNWHVTKPIFKSQQVRWLWDYHAQLRNLADSSQAQPSETYQVKHRISLHRKAYTKQAKQTKQSKQSKTSKQPNKPNQTKVKKQANQGKVQAYPAQAKSGQVLVEHPKLNQTTPLASFGWVSGRRSHCRLRSGTTTVQLFIVVV